MRCGTLPCAPHPGRPSRPAKRATCRPTGWAGCLPTLLDRLNPSLLADALRPVAAHLDDAAPALRQFVDAQLLIAAQTTSAHANALYGASALDLPRRGVVHLRGGIGTIAETLVQAVRAHGGKVLYRQEVTRIVVEHGRTVAVETKRGDTFPADLVVANLPPWNIAALLGDAAPPKLRSLPEQPAGWLGRVHGVRRPRRLCPAAGWQFSTTRWSCASRWPKATRSFSR